MGDNNKVVWMEGMFLHPQHFQQQDRYVEHLVRSRVDEAIPFGWGFSMLDIDEELLAIGQVGLRAARGVFPDGTPFSIPADAARPAPLSIAPTQRGQEVRLALAYRQEGKEEIGGSGLSNGAARFGSIDLEEVGDTHASGGKAIALSVAELRPKLISAAESTAGYVTLGIARVADLRPDNTLVLDGSYIPSCVRCEASGVLHGFLGELQGLLHQRGEALAGRLGQPGMGGIGEISDFLLLRAINGFEPVIAHLATCGAVHPERLYSVCVNLAGELSTYFRPGKRPATYPLYQHHDLTASFTPLFVELRRLLSAVVEQTAMPIPLEEKRYGIRVAVLNDKNLVTNARFVLAVRAAVAPEQVRRQFPNHVKIGSVEAIRELVNVALPGINLSPLPVAPRQIPFHSGSTYFELDRSGEHWNALRQSSGLALHVSGEFPQLELDLWAIRE